jgi:hypothetical protein
MLCICRGRLGLEGSVGGLRLHAGHTVFQGSDIRMGI